VTITSSGKKFGESAGKCNGCYRKGITQGKPPERAEKTENKLSIQPSLKKSPPGLTNWEETAGESRKAKPQAKFVEVIILRSRISSRLAYKDKGGRLRPGRAGGRGFGRGTGESA